MIKKVAKPCDVTTRKNDEKYNIFEVFKAQPTPEWILF